MRILFAVPHYAPLRTSSAKMMYDLGQEFVRRGHEVIVATPGENPGGDVQTSVEDGVTVLRFPIGRIRGINIIRRTINEMRISAVMLGKGRRFFEEHRCDLVIFWSPTLFLGKLARSLKRMWNCRTYLIVRDIAPQWYVDSGVLRKGLIYWYFKQMELLQYGVSDTIGYQSPANLQYFTDQGYEKRYSFELLYNWIDTSTIPARPAHIRERFNLQGKILFTYGGSMGTAQDMDSVMMLADRLQSEEQVHFLLVGEGNEVERIRAFVKEKGLSNLTLLGAVAQEDYLGMLGESDVGLVTLNQRLTTHNFPGKMLGYMLCSLPLLACVNPQNDMKHAVEEAEAGFVTDNGDYEELLRNAVKLIGSAELRKKMGANARKLLEDHFSVVRAADTMLSHMGNL